MSSSTTDRAHQRSRRCRRERADAIWRRLWAVLLVLVTIFQPACTCELITEDTAKALTGPLAELVETAPELIENMDDLVETAVSGVDEALANNIQELSRAIHNQLDAINELMGENIERVDAAVAARLQQLIDFVHEFNRDLERIISGSLRQLNYSVESMLARLEVTGESLLDEAGFTAVRTIREGGKVVAVVIGGVIETVILVIAGLVLFLSLLLGGLFFYRALKRKPRPSKLVLGMGTGFFAAGLVIGVVFVSVPSVRASVASGRYPLYQDDSECTRAIGEALAFLADVGEAKIGETPDDAAKALDHYMAMNQCIGAPLGKDLRERAREIAAKIERGLGFEFHCRDNAVCPIEQHCDLVLGVCTSRCDVDQECRVPGDLCHVAAGGFCAPSCTRDADCGSATLKCDDEGQCAPKGDTGSGSIKPGHWFPHGVFEKKVFDMMLHCPRCPKPLKDPRDPVVLPEDRVRSIGVYHELLKNSAALKQPHMRSMPFAVRKPAGVGAELHLRRGAVQP